MNKLLLYIMIIFGVAISFNQEAMAQSHPPAAENIDLVEKYGLFTTNKIEFSHLKGISNARGSFEIAQNDIPLLLDTLKNVSYIKGMDHRCPGDYDINFFTADGVVSLNLGHRTSLRVEGGLCTLGDDFIDVIKKYSPEYFSEQPQPKN